MNCDNAVLGEDLLPLVAVQRSHFDRLITAAEDAQILLFYFGAAWRQPGPESLALALELHVAILEILANSKEVAAR